MSHGTEHHLEEAEHVQHAAHDPFDKRVAMTMAIVAAVLACVTMLSHRAHNRTLQLQMQATDEFTQASNTWNQYQAQKNRQYLYETQLLAIRMAAPNPSNPRASADQKKVQRMEEDVERYSRQTEELKSKAESFQNTATDLRHRSDHRHHVGDRYDQSELAVELALVLCALAILSKTRGFWYTGIVFRLMGLGVALSAWFEWFLPH